MSGVVALGESARVAGYALAGVLVIPTDGVGAAAAWDDVPDGTGLLVLTPTAAAELADRLARPGRLLWAVLPE